MATETIITLFSFPLQEIHPSIIIKQQGSVMTMDISEDHIDLHLHSCHSDGLHSPADLVKMAAARGLRAIAITDHDSVAGIDEALAAGEILGV